MPKDDNENRNNNQGGRGFSGMDPKKQKKIASEGGKAAHEKGTAHEWDSDEGKEAGRKGGSVGSRSDDDM